MLVVKVELWPGGVAAARKELGELRIANVSDLADVSDYTVTVREPHRSDRRYRVRAHERKRGFWRLILRSIATIEPGWPGEEP